MTCSWFVMCCTAAIIFITALPFGSCQNISQIQVADVCIAADFIIKKIPDSQIIYLYFVVSTDTSENTASGSRRTTWSSLLQSWKALVTFSNCASSTSEFLLNFAIIRNSTMVVLQSSIS